ncbi:hypothetical protein ICL16_37885 [Iningainema sp. BLCCT55]|uniref:Uncharacterized protein n=1 Tax=Iningainema tapete BLCC-T55 TaxID=2748662 RepID=A0A8J6XSR1_9CYAN|nr:hypothetical protein [Iningainema tapete BLCC-T55]
MSVRTDLHLQQGQESDETCSCCITATSKSYSGYTNCTRMGGKNECCFMQSFRNSTIELQVINQLINRRSQI